MNSEGGDNNWVKVHTFQDLPAAEMVAANLESGGIETILMNQKDSSYPASGMKGGIGLYVRSENEEEAKEYIRITLAGGGEPLSDEGANESE